MFNLTEIMQAAQGGQGINNIAAQFGLSPDQAQAAVKALMPGMSMGLQNQAASTDGLSSLLGMLTGGAHTAAFHEPAATAAPQTVAAGNDVLGQLFGGPQATQAIAQHAANVAGISSSMMQSMMPVVASMVMGGLFKGASSNGLGGLLSAASGGGGAGGLAGMLAQAMGGAGATAGGGLGGGLGGLLGGLMGGGQQAQAATGAMGGGMGGMLGNLLGGLMGGGKQAAAPQAAAPANPMSAGLEMLQSMMNHGQQVQDAHSSALQDIFNTLVKK